MLVSIPISTNHCEIWGPQWC